MFNRKVLLAALLAVTLLGSLMDAGVGIDKRHRRKPRATVADSVAMVDQTLRQASLTDLMNQVIGSAADDQDNQLFSFRDKGKHRRPRAAMDAGSSIEIAGGARTPDPTGTSRA